MIRPNIMFPLICLLTYAAVNGQTNPCASQPCASGMVCVREGSSFTCASQCDVENPCLNDGNCQTIEGGYYCVCPPAFTGDHCETAINPCDASPCLESESCTQDGSSYICYIPCAGENPCNNDGICQEQGEGYNCICPREYTGENCEIVIDPCDFDPCPEGQSCASEGTEYTCTSVCQPHNPCYNDGTCQIMGGGYYCTCPPGYTGDHCELETQADVCEHADPCLHDSTCQTLEGGYQCICPPDYTGRHCDTPSSYCDATPCDGCTFECGGTLVCARAPVCADMRCEQTCDVNGCGGNIWCSGVPVHVVVSNGCGGTK